jgi:hypothetical protein
LKSGVLRDARTGQVVEKELRRYPGEKLKLLKKWLQLLSKTRFKSSLIEWLTRLACPAMLIPKLLHLDLYTGRKGHLAHAS